MTEFEYKVVSQPMNLCARVFALIVVFAAAVGCFWALGLG